jgi:hypothetical protein
MPSFSEHIWMLQGILNTCTDRTACYEALSLYMAAACFPKMYRRINHSLSKPFLEVLRNIDVKGISFNNSRDGDAKTSMTNKYDKDCLLRLAEQKSLHKYNKLLELSEITKKSTSFGGLYTSDTCQQFHQLLVELVWSYARDLSNMKLAYDGKAPEGFSFCEASGRVHWTGRWLQTLCKGVALQIHLKNIENLLSSIDSFDVPQNTNKHGRDGKSDDEEDEFDAEIDDLREVKETGDQPISHSRVFLNWLKLIIVQFDAANIITSGLHAGSNHLPVSVGILEAPLVTNTMMHWRSLIQRSDFPAQAMPNITNGSPASTNDQLIAHLTEGVNSNRKPTSDDASKAREIWKAACDAAIVTTDGISLQADDQAKFMAVIEKLCKTTVPACPKAVINILLILANMDTTPVEKDPIKLFEIIQTHLAQTKNLVFKADRVDLVNVQLRFIIDTCIIYKKFAATSEMFHGTLHCEVNLASLISLAMATSALLPDPKYGDLFSKLQVGNAMYRFALSLICCQ